MRSLKIAGLCFASMLVMGMALAGNAAAANGLLWLVCLKGVGLTKYTSKTCLKATAVQNLAEEGWQSLGLLPNTSITVKILTISIKLEDTKATIATSVTCANTGSRGEGLIEPGGKGKILVAEYANAKANCEGHGGCKAAGVKSLSGVNLPWNTELFEGTEKKPLTKISAHAGGGSPGWKVVCENILGGEETDTCEEEAASGPEELKLPFGEVTKNPGGEEELLVRTLFQENHSWHCTVGGAKAGRVSGTLALLLPGGALSINKF